MKIKTYMCFLLYGPKCFLLLSGIQQKYIVVTCNYVARERGVSKLMSVADAKKKCPELVLVKGEDLTHYREMYYKVTGRQENRVFKGLICC